VSEAKLAVTTIGVNAKTCNLHELLR